MRNTVLIVDDDESERSALKQVFEGQYSVAEVENSREAVDYLEDFLNEVIMLLVDIHQMEEDEYRIMCYMKERDKAKQIPIFMIADKEEQDAIELGYQSGAAEIIERPFVRSIIEKRAGNVLELYGHVCYLRKEIQEETKKIQQKTEELKEHHEHLINILRDIITNRNVESVQHIQCVQGYTRILANQYAELYPDAGMTEEKIEMIVQAAQMHDVGKITVPDSVTGRPGRLSPYEMELLKEHTVKGSEIMKVMSEIAEDDYSRICYNVCRYHHEKYDGSGYPEGIKGDDIPIEAQIVGLADMYDVLVNATVNKEAFTPNEAFYKLIKGDCGEISSEMKECLEAARDSLETFTL